MAGPVAFLGVLFLPTNSSRSPACQWHFAEQAVADYFHNYAEYSELTNIVVIYTPAYQP